MGSGEVTPVTVSHRLAYLSSAGSRLGNLKYTWLDFIWGG